MAISTARGEFLAGVRATLPLVAGAAPFGVLFGVLALTAGLPWWAAQGMSVFVFAGAAQMIAVALIAGGTLYPLIVLTTFAVNMRHALYGASVARYLRGLPKMVTALLAFGMTDESYAVTITHYREGDRGVVGNKHWFFLGANLAMFVPWNLSTALGYWVGRTLGNPLALGLDFTLTLVLIAILIPQVRERASLVVAIVAGLVGVLTFALPNKFGLLLAIGAGIAAGVVVEKWNWRA